MTFTMTDMREYDRLAQAVVEHGRKTRPRGMVTHEVEDAVIYLESIDHALPTGVGRNLRPEIGAAEALLICGGIASPSLLTSVSDNFRRFLDGGDLHGGYGRRVGPQLDRLVDRLLKDGDTRQAIISIWDPFYDQVDTRDLPCTLNLGFRIRNGKLNASVTMRSNDVFLGTAYDIFTFTQLQWTIANVLGIEPGTFALHAYSLHAYERNFDAIEALHPYSIHEDELVEQPHGFASFNEARQVYDDALPAKRSTDSLRWYYQTLKPYDRLTSRENFS